MKRLLALIACAVSVAAEAANPTLAGPNVFTGTNSFTAPVRVVDATSPSTNTATGTNITIWDGGDNKGQLDTFRLRFDTSDTHAHYGQSGVDMTNSSGEITKIHSHASFLGGVVSMTNLSLVDPAAPTTNSQSGAGISIWDGGDGGMWLDENSMKFGSGGGNLNARYSVGGMSLTNHENHEVTIATAGRYQVTQDATSTTINPSGVGSTNSDDGTWTSMQAVPNDSDYGFDTSGSIHVGFAVVAGNMTLSDNAYIAGTVGVGGELTNAGPFSFGANGDGVLFSSGDVLHWSGAEIDAALFFGDGSGLQNLVAANVARGSVPTGNQNNFSVYGFNDGGDPSVIEVDNQGLPAIWLPQGVSTNTVSASANLGFGVITALSFSEKVVALTGVVTNAPISVGLPTNYPSLMLFDARCASNNFVNLRVYNLNTLSSVAYTNWFRVTAIQ